MRTSRAPRPARRGSLKAELGDHDGLGRIAGADGVEEWAERVTVVVATAAGVEPAEVLVVTDHVERRVGALAAEARPVADRHPDRPGGVELLRERGGAGDVARLGSRCRRGQLVADRPQQDRRVVFVREDVVLEHRVRLGEPAGLPEVLRLHLVDGDLRPDQDPVAVGHLLHLGTDRVMGADHGGAELLHPRHQLRVLRRRHRGPRLQRLLVQIDAAEVQKSGRSAPDVRPPP